MFLCVSTTSTIDIRLAKTFDKSSYIACRIHTHIYSAYNICTYVVGLPQHTVAKS